MCFGPIANLLCVHNHIRVLRGLRDKINSFFISHKAVDSFACFYWRNIIIFSTSSALFLFSCLQSFLLQEKKTSANMHKIYPMSECRGKKCLASFTPFKWRMYESDSCSIFFPPINFSLITKLHRRRYCVSKIFKRLFLTLECYLPFCSMMVWGSR